MLGDLHYLDNFKWQDTILDTTGQVTITLCVFEMTGSDPCRLETSVGWSQTGTTSNQFGNILFLGL